MVKTSNAFEGLSEITADSGSDQPVVGSGSFVKPLESANSRECLDDVPSTPVKPISAKS